MARWLLKEEPEHYSFEDLSRDGETVWDGVTNALALIHIRKMKSGDSALIYHTGRVKAGAPLPRAVALAEMRAKASLAGFDLLRISRLSIVPVGDAHWKEIMK